LFAETPSGRGRVTGVYVAKERFFCDPAELLGSYQ